MRPPTGSVPDNASTTGKPTGSPESDEPGSQDDEDSAPAAQHDPTPPTIIIDGPDLAREADGFTSTGGAFDFAADVGGAADVSFAWHVDGALAGMGPRISYTLEVPGDHVVSITTTSASGARATNATVLRIPSNETHWFTGSVTPITQTTGGDVEGSLVVILPAVYGSSGMLQNSSWIAPGAFCDHPAIRATLEAIAYWQWLFEQGAADHPQLKNVRWQAKTMGCDASLSDVADADMTISITMFAEDAPPPPIWVPMWQFFGLSCGDPQPAINAGAQLNTNEPFGVRNLVLHEFGHCIGSGHTGDHTTGHCSPAYGCYTNHPEDIMSGPGPSDFRWCLSNLNLLSVAEAYDFRHPINDAAWYDGEAFMLKDQHQFVCMPDSLKRF